MSDLTWRIWAEICAGRTIEFSPLDNVGGVQILLTDGQQSVSRVVSHREREAKVDMLNEMLAEMGVLMDRAPAADRRS